MAGGGRTACVWFLLLWLAAEVQGQKAPVGAPAPSVDCSSVFPELIDCLSYVQNGQNVTKPEGQCCSNLKKVVKNQVSCLCEVFKQGATFGINITKALTLPSACGVSTPSVSKCKIDIPGVPAAAPGLSPSASAAPSSRATGAPSPSTGKSAAAAYPVPSFGFLTSMTLALWLCYQSHGLEF